MDGKIFGGSFAGYFPAFINMNIEADSLSEKGKNRPWLGFIFLLSFGAVLILCIGILALNGLVLIGPDQRGVVISAFEPNGYRAEPLTPGIHWIRPVFENVQIYSMAPQTYTMSSTSSEDATQADDSIRARTKDGQQVFIDASVTYAIDPSQLLKLHIDWQNRYADGLIRPVTRAATREVFLQYDAAEINGAGSGAIEQLIGNEIKQNLISNYLILLDFTIQEIRLN